MNDCGTQRSPLPVLGYDISHHQQKFDHQQALKAGFRFCYAKASDGSEFQDDRYEENREGALDAGMYFAAYHWLRSDHPINAQVKNLAHVLGKHKQRTPVVLDVELLEDKNDRVISAPTLKYVRMFLEAAREEDIRISLLYLPKWYWRSRWHEHVLPKLPPLINSHYGGEDEPGKPADLYPGDRSERWDKYGGIEPTILQFTDKGIVGGQKPICLDAYRGRAMDLDRWFFRRERVDPVPDPDPEPDPEPSPEPDLLKKMAHDIEVIKARTRLIEAALEEGADNQAVLAAIEALGSDMDNMVSAVTDEVMARIQTLRVVAGSE